MKKTLSLLVLMAFMLSITCSCAEQSKNTVIDSVGMLAENDSAALEYAELITKFQTDNSGITINDVSQSSTEEWKQGVIESFYDNPPDVVFFFTGAPVKQLILDNKLVSISEIQEVYPDYASNIRESTMECMREVDGKYYAVPVRGFFEGLFCNKELFDRYNLALPKDWDSFILAVNTFKQNNVIPIAASLLDVPHYWIEHMILSQGGPIEHRLNPFTYVPDSWVRALERLKTIYEVGAFSPDTLTSSNADTTTQFTSGKAAMILDGSWLMSEMSEGDKYEVVPFPAMPGGKKDSSDIVSGYSSGFYISRDAWENPIKRDAAVRFVQFMTSDESIALICKNGGAPAADVQLEGKSTLLSDSAAALQQNAKHVNMPIDSNLNKDAWGYLCTSIKDIVTGKVSAREVLNKIAETNKW